MLSQFYWGQVVAKRFMKLFYSTLHLKLLVFRNQRYRCLFILFYFFIYRYGGTGLITVATVLVSNKAIFTVLKFSYGHSFFALFLMITGNVKNYQTVPKCREMSV